MDNLPRKKPGPKSKRPTNRVLKRLYVDLDHSAVEIADFYGVSVSAVRYWIRKAREENKATEEGGQGSDE